MYTLIGILILGKEIRKILLGVDFMERNDSVILLESVKKEMLRQKYMNKIFKYQDIIEYCLVDDYEGRYLNFGYKSVSIDLGFWKEISLVEKGGHILLSAIIFKQNGYSSEGVLDWLESNKVIYINADKYNESFVVKNVSEISNVLLYKGNLIVTYVPGKEEVVINKNDYKEVTKYFTPMHRIANTKDAENIFLEDEGE